MGFPLSSNKTIVGRPLKTLTGSYLAAASVGPLISYQDSHDGSQCWKTCPRHPTQTCSPVTVPPRVQQGPSQGPIPSLDANLSCWDPCATRSCSSDGLNSAAPSRCGLVARNKGFGRQEVFWQRQCGNLPLRHLNHGLGLFSRGWKARDIYPMGARPVASE